MGKNNQDQYLSHLLNKTREQKNDENIFYYLRVTHQWLLACFFVVVLRHSIMMLWRFCAYFSLKIHYVCMWVGVTMRGKSHIKNQSNTHTHIDFGKRQYRLFSIDILNTISIHTSYVLAYSYQCHICSNISCMKKKKTTYK